MSNSKQAPGDGDPQADGEGDGRDPDLSVPELEIEQQEVGAAPDLEQDDSPSRRGFSAGQWILLWLVITLGVASGHLLSHYIRAVVGPNLGVAPSDIAEGLGTSPDEAKPADDSRKTEPSE